MLWVLIRSALQGASNEYLQHLFLWKNKKNINTLDWKNILSKATLVTVFSEKTDVPPPPPPPHPPIKFHFFYAMTLKIRSRSPKSNQFFVLSQLYIHENLVRIKPLVHKLLCREESETPMPTGSASKIICPLPYRPGYIINMVLPDWSK